ncbi:MAG TPA: DUF4013 domain-containing protein [Pirellulaceae bacterium]|nr:DUF4013 domain-containing protein [Pirellulaceae bacterium]HMO91402.1 DUF4013 domain-containing protein [Pirellulaceae bacterium]HMP69627.1 DUF4013 domain-containing protein [Pirellulaceae bacterium]
MDSNRLDESVELDPDVVDAAIIIADEIIVASFVDTIVPENLDLGQYSPSDVANIADRRPKSWPFRLLAATSWFCSRLFGIVSMIVILAILASIPLAQLLSFGYLFEVVGRVGRSGHFASGFVGLGKASRIGGAVLGTFLCLLPIQFLSVAWYNAWIIDSNSTQTYVLKILQVAAVALILPHIIAAWFCGGKFRYFIWPLLAPFSLFIWAARQLTAVPALYRILSTATDWCAPGLAEDISGVKPLQDWFLPAIVIHHGMKPGRIALVAQRLWDFFAGLRLFHYFKMGLLGFVGSFLWLFGPTMLLIGSTMLISDIRLSPGQLAVIDLLLAMVALTFCAVVFAVLPAMQARFAVTQRMTGFFEFGDALRAVRGAPILYWLAVVLMFLLAVPLLLLNIEPIPQPLMWILAVFFVVLIWPGKIFLGYAYGKGALRQQPRRWWFSIPILGSLLPITFLYAFLLFFSRYTAWNGAWSLLENQVFLLPIPFWLAT